MCGKAIKRRPSEVQQHAAFYCSPACKRQGHRGAAVPNYRNQDRWVTGQGYVYIRTADGSRRYEHRVVMEQHLGRKLLRNEHIHHLSGDKSDNRLENLAVLTPSEHARLHRQQRGNS